MSISEVDVQNVVEYISKWDTNKVVGVELMVSLTKFIPTYPHCMASLLTKLINGNILLCNFPA